LGEGFFPDQAPDDIDLECLAGVAAEQFADRLANPRAMVVIYKGQLVFEHYAANVTKDSPLIGWSASKSLTQALIGILVNDSRMDIMQPADVPEWREDPTDPRQNITVDMMLRMSSGTLWVGDILPTTKCIFYSNQDCAHVCALQPLVQEPDTEWNYNSGSTYVLSRIVQQARGDPQYNNFEWPKRRLFHPIGANSMYIEYQANEQFLGGSYGYGIARDWARFGLLYLREGVWVDGTRLLPPGWTEYSSRPNPHNAGYAAHFWRQEGIDPRMFTASGFRNQVVWIMPNQDLVIVRLAMPPPLAVWVFDSNAFVNSVLSCIRPAKV